MGYFYEPNGLMRRIDIEDDSERLRIEFPYDRSLVQTVKTLPERRFDPDTKDWYVPFQHVERVFETLLDHHFKISQELRSYCEEHHRPVDEILEKDGEADGPASVPPGTWTVSELNLEAQSVLEEAFDRSLWLVGELQSYDRTRDWRHAFFELVDRPTDEADPVAKIQAVMFQRHRERIEEALAEAPDDIRLRDGLTVRVCGDVELYPEKGAYQFVVREIDPTYTAGEIQRNRQVILDTLEKRGIREQSRQLPWPDCPLRVGLITSYGSDAYSDFLDQLEASDRGFQLTVHDAYVQGDRTESSILEALAYFEERADQFDAVVIVRGGGARSDLAYFDTEAIGEAVCQHPLKIVCGIGHQRDVCLLDHICESEKTPTA
ncbi:MAG: exodeoxyribonuclease VII large subunit, partial [Bradymonadaceae bacterium]